MVTVPKFCPEVPALKNNPVFLYFYDRFQKPYPFQPDIAVAIDSVMDKKLEVLLGMVSQFYEGGVGGSPELLSSDPERQRARWRAIRERFTNRQLEITSRCRKSLEEWYGAKRAAQIVYAEAFEVGEYGRRPDATELKRLFPFFD
jgi:hypothetical protein